MNSTDLKNLIIAKHPLPEWATFEELRNSTGYVKNARTADVATFNTYPSKSKRIAYEIKVYRSDFIKELEQPEKRKWCEDLFHETYFVCLPDVCKPEEVPEGWGLYYPTKNGKHLRRKIIARYREIEEDLPYWFTLSIFRRLCESLNNERRKIRYIDGEEFTSEQLEKYIDEKYWERHDVLEKQREKLNKKIAEAVEAKDKLIKPFSTLNRIVHGRYAWFDKDNITSEQVEEWANKVKASVFLKTKDKVLAVRYSLNELVEDMEKLEKENAQNTK